MKKRGRWATLEHDYCIKRNGSMNFGPMPVNIVVGLRHVSKLAVSALPSMYVERHPQGEDEI
jgi:hypothetical protein